MDRTVTSYGEHAERAADALELLIRSDELPDLGDVDVVLVARQAVIGALTERVAHLGQAHIPTRAGTTVSTTDLEDEPVALLVQAIRDLPRLTHPPMSPMDALGPTPTDPVGEQWVTAARELLAAGHVLDTSVDKPWRTNPTAYWHLVGDTAQVLEALTVLDHRLDEVGLLPHRIPHDPEALSSAGRDLVNEIGRLEKDKGITQEEAFGRLGVDPDAARLTLVPPPPEAEPWSRDDVRIIAAHLTRLGSWYGDHAVTDLAYSPDPAKPFIGPVRMVRNAGDIADAQRQLGRYLNPGPRADAHTATAPRIQAWTAVVVAKGQEQILDHLHERVRSRPDLREQLPRVEDLRSLVRDVRQAMRGLHDVAPPPRDQLIQNKAAQGQQQELSNAMRRNPGLRTLTDVQTADLLAATETTLGTFGQAFRREARRPDSQLRLLRQPAIDQPPEPVRITRTHSSTRNPRTPGTLLEQRVNALATYAPPTIPSTIAPPRAREALQQILDRTPLAERAPQPPTLVDYNPQPPDRGIER